MQQFHLISSEKRFSEELKEFLRSHISIYGLGHNSQKQSFHSNSVQTNSTENPLKTSNQSQDFADESEVPPEEEL